MSLKDNAQVSRLPVMPLGILGQWIKDASGRVVIVRGVNMINKLPPYTPSSTGFGAKDAELMAQHGFNIVRVGVIYSALEPAPGVYDDVYLGDIQKTVSMLHDHEIMSLIDFHQDGWGPSFVCEGFPEWATLTDGIPIRPLRDTNFPGLLSDPPVMRAWDNFWKNAQMPDGVPLQVRFALAWRHAVEFLKGTPGILGWELLNEPWPATQPTQRLTDFTKFLVSEIRKVDTEHMIWYEPWVTFDDGVKTEIGRIEDSYPLVSGLFAFYRPQGQHCL